MNSLFGRIAAGRVAQLSLLVDLLVVAAALAAASLLGGRELAPGTWGFAASAMALWLVAATALRHYDPWASDRAAADDASLVSVLVLSVTGAVAVGELVLGPAAGLPSASVYLVVLWPTALIVRFGAFRAFSKREDPVDEVLVVGTGAMGRATAADLQRRGRRNLIGFVRFSAEQPAASGLRGRILGDVSELEALLRRVPVGEVYLATTSLKFADEVQQAVKVCERLGIPFAMPTNFFRLERARPLETHSVGDGFIHYQSGSFKPTQMAIKRAFDILLSAVGLWLLAPFLVGVAVAIKLTSRGPVLFKQQRVGLHGRPFNMLKFRTMVPNAEALKAQLAAKNEMDGPVFKMKADPRITPLGRVLRKFSIDELPQLLNVLRGDMSVVGPRPPVPSEVAKYEGWQRRRLSVRPGLTCIWQVSGRNEISFEQWMYLDLQYIDHWSFMSDLSLILKTVPVVLTGRGAS